MKHIAIFASGEGTNVENIARYFEHNDVAKVAIVLSDRENANVLNRAAKLNVPARSFSKQQFYESDEILNLLKQLNIDLIVLAGFLKLVPEKIINHYRGRIINIHPALLPKHGGKGMYGMNVHRAVHAACDKETGITIHHVNEKFDEGEIIFQEKVMLNENDSPEKILEKIRKLELESYPKVIEKLLR